MKVAQANLKSIELKYLVPEVMHVRLEGVLADREPTLRDRIAKRVEGVTFSRSLISADGTPLLEIKFRPKTYHRLRPKVIWIVQELVLQLT
mgnify:CR=1 FL=1